MKSIRRNKQVNLGGSIVLCFIPVSLVDKDNFPERIPGTLTIDSPIPLLGSAKWLSIAAERESIDSSDNSKLNKDGSLYDHSVGGFHASDNWEVTDQFDKMQAEGRYLVLRKDANVFWALKGTTKEPLVFSFSKVSRDRITGLKGYEFKFSGQCTKPELYFNSAFEIDDTLIPNNVFPYTFPITL